MDFDIFNLKDNRNFSNKNKTIYSKNFTNMSNTIKSKKSEIQNINENGLQLMQSFEENKN